MKAEGAMFAARFQQELDKLGVQNPQVQILIDEAIITNDDRKLRSTLRQSGLAETLHRIALVREMLSQELPFEFPEQEVIDGPIRIGKSIDEREVGLSPRDLCRHVSVDGTTGTGKTSVVRLIVKGLVDAENA